MPPPPPEAATPVRLSSLEESQAGMKVRVAGLTSSYSPDTDLVLLVDRDTKASLILDVSLCTGTESAASALWFNQRRALVTALGYLEVSEDPLPMPVLPGTRTNAHLVLRALLVTDAPDLDLALWNTAIAAREALAHPST